MTPGSPMPTPSSVRLPDDEVATICLLAAASRAGTQSVRWCGRDWTVEELEAHRRALRRRDLGAR